MGKGANTILERATILAKTITVVTTNIFFFLIPDRASIDDVSNLNVILSGFIPLPLSIVAVVLGIILLVVKFFAYNERFNTGAMCADILLPIFLKLFRGLFPRLNSVANDRRLSILYCVLIIDVKLDVLFGHGTSSNKLSVITGVVGGCLRVRLKGTVSLSKVYITLSTTLICSGGAIILDVLNACFGNVILSRFVFSGDVGHHIYVVARGRRTLHRFVLRSLRDNTAVCRTVNTCGLRGRGRVVAVISGDRCRGLVGFVGQRSPGTFIAVCGMSDVRCRPGV